MQWRIFLLKTYTTNQPEMYQVKLVKEVSDSTPKLRRILRKFINIESNNKFLRMLTHFNCAKCHWIMTLVATYWKFRWKQNDKHLYSMCVHLCGCMNELSPLTHFTSLLYLLLFAYKTSFHTSANALQRKINNSAFQGCNSDRRCVQAILSKIMKQKRERRGESAVQWRIAVVAQHKPIIEINMQQEKQRQTVTQSGRNKKQRPNQATQAGGNNTHTHTHSNTHDN